MEQFYKDPRTPLRMREGPLGAYVDDLGRQLRAEVRPEATSARDLAPSFTAHPAEAGQRRGHPSGFQRTKGPHRIRCLE